MVLVIVGGAEFRLADRPGGKLPPDFFQQADFQPPGGRQIHLPQQGGIHGRFPGERVTEGREKLEHRQRAGPQFHGPQQWTHEKPLQAAMQTVAVAGVESLVEAEAPLPVQQRMAEPAGQFAGVIFDITIVDGDHPGLLISGQGEARTEPDIPSFSGQGHRQAGGLQLGFQLPHRRGSGPQQGSFLGQGGKTFPGSGQFVRFRAVESDHDAFHPGRARQFLHDPGEGFGAQFPHMTGQDQRHRTIPGHVLERSFEGRPGLRAQPVQGGDASGMGQGTHQEKGIATGQGLGK